VRVSSLEIVVASLKGLHAMLQSGCLGQLYRFAQETFLGNRGLLQALVVLCAEERCQYCNAQGMPLRYLALDGCREELKVVSAHTIGAGQASSAVRIPHGHGSAGCCQSRKAVKSSTAVMPWSKREVSRCSKFAMGVYP
jgi:hypothetical protein